MRMSNPSRRRWLLAAGVSLVVGASALVPTTIAGAQTATAPPTPAAPSGGQLSPRLLAVAPPEVAASGAAGAATRALGETGLPSGLPSSGPGSLSRQPDGHYLVDVRVTDATSATQDRLEATGASIVSVNPEIATITVAATPEQLASVAGVSGVKYVDAVLTPKSHAACPTGVVDEGDAQLLANTARSTFGVDGTGVKVGVMSSSYNLKGGAAADVAGGDLPGPGNPCGFTTPVTDQVESPVPGQSDEGRAMTQIVHDLAPNASLAFATALNSEGSMANNIRALRDGGANVIVDDVTYFAEPMYQDGVIAKAVNDVTATGTSYFSSAGNENATFNGHAVGSYEAVGGYRPGPCPAGLPAGYSDCHNFNTSGPDDTDDSFTLGTNGEALFSIGWNEPQGGVSTDFDAFLLSTNGQIIDQSINTSTLNGIPAEVVGAATDAVTAGTARLVIARRNGSTGTPRFKFVMQAGFNLTNVEHTTPSGTDVMGPTIMGHNAARAAGTIGAVPFNNGSTVETFSSTGPATYCWQPVGSEINPGTGSPSAPLSPCQTKGVDVAATDGTANSFFGSLFGATWRFFGTSASAPHAAAVAALQLQARPCRTPAEIIAAQRAGAVAIANPAASGSGRLNAVAAIQQLAACPATHFGVSAPSDATKNVPAFVTVSALDVTNHVATSYAGTVHITSTDGAATLPADTTLTNGVGTIQVTFQTLGNQKVTATDTVDGTKTGQSANIAVANPFGYHGVAPVRILDSRPGPESKQYSTKWGGGTDRAVAVTGTITGGAVPDTASAVAINVTVVNPTQGSDLRIYPTGQTRPNTSSLNFSAGQVIPNLVIARVGTNHTIQIFNNQGSVDVIADVVGWFDDGSNPGGGDLYHPLAPKRILESRPQFSPLQYNTPWGEKTDRLVQVRGGTTTVPADATAVIMNVTAVNPTAGSDLRVYPSGTSLPTTSNLNFVAGKVIPNLVISRIGTDGNVRIFNDFGNVDVIADVVGYFGPAVGGGGPYHPLTPSRVLETRPQFNPLQYSVPWGDKADKPVQITGNSVPGHVPPNATAVVLNVTAVFPSAGTDLRVYPDGQPLPNASNLNVGPGDVVPNLVVVGLGPGGKIRIFNDSGNVDVIADVVGYFT